MSVESVIELVLRRYAGARAYTDRGTSLVEVGPTQMRIEFETSFEREGRFSFSFTDGSAVAGRSEKVGVEWDGSILRMSGFPPHVQPASLELAIAALTGVSMGCAHRIPRMLMPDTIGGRRLFEWTHRALGERVTIDDDSHFTVYLRDRDEIMLVYVSETTLLVRRIEGPDPVTVTDFYATLTA